MFSFADIHCHALCGVDDGASDEREMCAMLRMAYADGTRTLCLTPHYAPDMFGVRTDAIESAFLRAEQYCREQLPGMKLFRGNELNYRAGSVEALLDGRCHTLAGTRYVLVDFWMTVNAPDLVRGVSAIANSGYIPVVAHVERYDCMVGKVREIAELASEGALIQINAGSVCMSPFTKPGRMARRLLSEGLVDIVASDGHNLTTRPPLLSDAYHRIRKKYGDRLANRLFSANPAQVLSGERVR